MWFNKSPPVMTMLLVLVRNVCAYAIVHYNARNYDESFSIMLTTCCVSTRSNCRHLIIQLHKPSKITCFYHRAALCRWSANQHCFGCLASLYVYTRPRSSRNIVTHKPTAPTNTLMLHVEREMMLYCYQNKLWHMCIYLCLGVRCTD